MDQINCAIQEANDREQMMIRVLDTMLAIFNCDRAWLVYPCVPTAPSWHVPMERTKPEYRGVFALKVSVPMDPSVAKMCVDNLAVQTPLKYGPRTGREVPPAIQENYSVKAIITMAMHPKGDDPWMFGMHQCSYARSWTPQEERLFQEIGRRLTDGLTSLLAYRKLQKSEEKYRRMVETASEGVWMATDENVTTFVNARMATMLGYTVDEMIGQPLQAFIHKSEIADFSKKAESRRQGEVQTFERRLRHKSGQDVWGLVSVTPVFDEQTNFKGSFGMFTDISERKRTEAELIKAKETAENLASVKARFLDIAAHELRSPVTSLSLTLELAKKQVKEQRPLDTPVFERLERQTNRLRRLVFDLLDVSRLDRGAMTLHRSRTDLVSLISGCVEEFKVQAPDRAIVFDPGEQAIEIELDAVRIQQVVSNLIDNALKYTPEETHVEVTAELLADVVRVSVIDHGSGISKEQVGELFKPFSRGRTEREERASGLGLGLVVCEGIVKLHGGTISVRSQPNVGSTFFFELPRWIL